MAAALPTLENVSPAAIFALVPIVPLFIGCDRNARGLLFPSISLLLIQATYRLRAHLTGAVMDSATLGLCDMLCDVL